MSEFWIELTTAMCCFAREKATLSRRSPPLLLMGPKFISILPLGPCP